MDWGRPSEAQFHRRRPVGKAEAMLLAQLDDRADTLGRLGRTEVAVLAPSGRSQPAVAQADAEPLDGEGRGRAQLLEGDTPPLQACVRVLAGDAVAVAPATEE